MARDLAISRVARIAWATWVSIMLATPYYLLNPYAGGRLSGKYAYIAFGLVIGALLVYFLRGKLLKLPKVAKIILIILTAIAVLASLFFVLLEWYRMPVYLAEGAESGWWGPRYRLPWVFELFPIRGNELMHIFCGAMCSLSGAWIFGGAASDESENRGIEGLKADVCKNSGFTFSAILPYLMFFGLLIAGFSLRSFFAPFFPYNRMDDFTIEFAISPYLMAVPYVFIFVFTVVTGKLLRKVEGELSLSGKQLEPTALYAMFILAFSLGMLCWNGLCHAFPNYSVGLFSIKKFIIALGVCCIIVLVLELIALFLVTKASKEKEKIPDTTNTEDESQIDSINFNEKLAALPGSDSLTERERDALRLMVEGASSSDSADALGISASTVRQYLSRAYKKLDIASSDEFKSLMFMGDTGIDAHEDALADSAHAESSDDSEASKQEHTQSRVSGWFMLHVWDIASLSGVAFFPLWCFLQKGFSRHLVDARILMVCIAWAMVLWGVWRIFCMLCPSFSLKLLSDNWRRCLKTAGRILFGVSGAIAAIGIWVPDNSLFVFKSRPMLVVYFAVFMFAVGCLSSLSDTFKRLKSKNSNSPRVALMAFAVILVLLGLASFNQLFSLAVGIIASIFAITHSFNNDVNFEFRKADVKQANDKQTFILGCCAFAFVGFYSEELAASSKYFDLGDSAVVFFIGLCLASMVFSLLMEKNFRIRVFLIAVYIFISVTGALFNQYLVTILLLILFSGMLIAKYLIFREVVFPAYSICFGTGTLVAFKAIRIANSALLLNDALFVNLSSIGFEDLFEWEVLVAGALLLSALAITIIYYRLILKDSEFVSISYEGDGRKSNENAKKAITYYLLSKGLSETQALVLYHVALGESVSSIADEIDYSKGTIKSACHIGYRQLGVHSREQLVSLLNRELSL